MKFFLPFFVLLFSSCAVETNDRSQTPEDKQLGLADAEMSQLSDEASDGEDEMPADEQHMEAEVEDLPQEYEEVAKEEKATSVQFVAGVQCKDKKRSVMCSGTPVCQDTKDGKKECYILTSLSCFKGCNPFSIVFHTDPKAKHTLYPLEKINSKGTVASKPSSGPTKLIHNMALVKFKGECPIPVTSVSLDVPVGKQCSIYSQYIGKENICKVSGTTFLPGVTGVPKPPLLCLEAGAKPSLSVVHYGAGLISCKADQKELVGCYGYAGKKKSGEYDYLCSTVKENWDWLKEVLPKKCHPKT